MLECCKRCVEEDLPLDVDYLRAHDRTVKDLERWLDMPQARLSTLIDVIVQGQGILSKRKRPLAGHLTEKEVRRIEQAVVEHFRLVQVSGEAPAPG